MTTKMHSMGFEPIKNAFNGVWTHAHICELRLKRSALDLSAMNAALLVMTHMWDWRSIYDNKNAFNGVWTHAHDCELRLKRSALDLSAMNAPAVLPVMCFYNTKCVIPRTSRIPRIVQYKMLCLLAGVPWKQLPRLYMNSVYMYTPWAVPNSTVHVRVRFVHEPWKTAAAVQ
jgi:hypothetical protein